VTSPDRSVHLRHALAGLQAGMTGAILMMLWTALASTWSRRSIWTIPNLYAATFHGSRALVNGYTRGSWAGVALMVFVCGIGGILWGIAWREGQRPFLSLFGLVTGLAVYYFLFDFAFRRFSPLTALYAPAPEMQIGYALWGLALARSPGIAERIQRAQGSAGSESM
jgi:hypothetical protein